MLNILCKNLMKTLIRTKSWERPNILGAIEQSLMDQKNLDDLKTFY